ncbi:nuclear transport factor 2 family protein [Streptomyces virginiae]|uniref:nuclear transport factor 2 family protein n=1 Tax=Streptomyces virginiae TaxID=1961 RepID=UPI00224D835A|nr:nuclear transport factor 2 family protein [Streptomyces virginiae]MCX4959774.1 nuclear transport factor 2 family protein [Streptomyces virginiae]
MTKMDTITAIKRMEDLFALQALVARFAHAVDTRDHEALSAVFVPDVTMEVAPDIRIDGRETLAGMLRDDLTWATTMHSVSNVLPEPEGDSATIHANITAVHVSRDGVGKHFDLGARYTFTAVRTADGSWLLSRIGIEPVWTTGDDQGMHDDR